MEEDNQEAEQQKRLGFGMVVAMWIIIFGLLVFFYSSWFDKQHNPNQNVSSRIHESGVREVTLQRNRYGHYVANGFINGQKVQFMVDTGATDIAVPDSVARRIGLKRGREQIYETANGKVMVYATILDSVDVGGIELHNVRASINPNMGESDILLGMTYLKNLEFTQRGDQLTLRKYAR